MTSLNAKDTKLINYAYDGNLQEVRKLLRMGANVNAQNVFGSTALMMASQRRHVEVVKALLTHNKVDVNVQHTDGATALIIASQEGHVEVVKALLTNNRVDVNVQRTTTGTTALFLASQNGHVEIVEALLQHNKVDVNLQRTTTGTTALYMASQNGHVDVVKALLTNEKVDVNVQRTDNGTTALYMASQEGHVEVVKALLTNEKVDVNLQRTTDGTTALYMASQSGHVEVVKALLTNNKVDVNLQQYSSGITALWMASQEGHLEVVKALLDHKQIDVNLQRTTDCTTALWMASCKGRVEVVQELLQHDKVDLNLQYSFDGTAVYGGTPDLDGTTALGVARVQGHVDVVCLLEEHAARVRALEKMRRRQDLFNRRPVESGAGNQEADDPPRSSENSTSRNDAIIKEDRTQLFKMMSSNSKDHPPVELSSQYILRCITDRQLGRGAFGDVFLAEDLHLPKKFVVKKIKLAQSDQEIIDQIQKSFQRELSTLKRFHHPNIIVLYGYNFNVNAKDQFLVYEYAANGSLDNFFRDDGNRARLHADTRLSIMFELVRAVHFLHTGGCQGWKVFHRDIKSANICLAEDFTARLIDCGLAKFVPDESSNIIPGSVTPSVRSTNGGPAFGTPGYMCLEYSRKKFEGITCPFIAAFDVFSIGVVMVELILGCLIAGQSTRNGMQFENAFRRYVKDDDDERIVDGWERLNRDADPSIIWNSESLELVCQTAIRCMAPSSKTRLSTNDLLPLLSKAIRLSEGIRNSEREGVGHGDSCTICNRNLASIKCSKGHALCASCIENTLRHGSGCQLSCLINGCSSHPFQDKDLFRSISVELYNRYIEKRADQANWEKMYRHIDAFRRSHQFDFLYIKDKVDEGNELMKQQQQWLEKQQQMLQKLAKGLDRSLAALSLLTANQFKECPNLVWVTPISVQEKYFRYPKKWIRNTFTQKYKVVFVCAHSREPGHEPFEIEMPKGWIAKIAPWLKLCLLVLKGSVETLGLPFPIPDLPFLEQCKRMKKFLDSVVEEGAKEGLSRCETLLENATTKIDALQYCQMQTLAGDAFKLIAEKAQKEKRSQWKPPQMVPVLDGNGTPIWVKGKYQKHYRGGLG